MTKLEDVLSKAITDSGYSCESIVLQKPKHEKFGDYSTPVSMQIAKKTSRNPLEIANQILSNLPINEIILKAEVIAPGFINIYINKDLSLKTAKNLLEKPLFLTKQVKKLVNKQYPEGVLLEHTGVNPSKSMHIGHLRNTCIGDCIYRFLKFLDKDVYCMYYQNDTGVQVSAIALALSKGMNDPKDYDSMLDWADATYSKVSKMIDDDPGLKQERQEFHKQMLDPSSPEFTLASDLSSKILQEILTFLDTIDIKFDFIIQESDIQINQVWEQAFSLLKKNKNFYLQESGDKKGCYMLKMPNQDDKIVVRSNGVPTYVANDIALHLWKFNQLKDFNYTNFPVTDQYQMPSSSPESQIEYSQSEIRTVVNVIGNEQSYPQEVVQQSLVSLGHEEYAENFIHINYGFVYLSIDSCKVLNLPFKPDDKRVKISGRAGTVLTLQSFLEIIQSQLKENFPDSQNLREIAIATIKYEFLKTDTYKDIVFDIQRACDLKGNTGSYLLYTCARAKAVIAKSQKTAVSDTSGFHLSDTEHSLLTQCNLFPEILAKLNDSFSPSLLCNYLQNLCLMYNSFYSNNKILGVAEENQRLFVTQLVLFILEKSFNLLGLPIVDKM